MITTVTNTNQLWSALKAAHAGDTVLLAPGVYSTLNLGSFVFPGTVTVQSADFAHQAVINGIAMSGSSGLAFNHIEINSGGATAVTVGGSHSISFDSVKIHGATVGDGIGMMIRDSSGVTVTNSDFGDLSSAINELNSSKLTVSNNVFHDLQAESIRGTGDTQEVISSNKFLSANPTIADHHDAINLWQDNTANGVVLSNNTFGTATTTHTTTPTPPPPAPPPPPPPPPPTPPPTTTAPPTTTTTAPAAPSTPPPTTTGPHTVTVSNANDLWSAVKGAHSGDTILLNPGNYGTLNLSGVNAAGHITVASANSSNEAVLTGLNISNSSGLVFDHLDISITGNAYGVRTTATSDMTFSNLKVHGSDPTDQGVGMLVRSSSGVTVTNSEFVQLGSGVSHLDSNELTITNNTFHNLNTDGIYGGGSSDVLVKGNTFTDFHPSIGVHPDAIQFYGGTGGAPGSNVKIEDNVITRGPGDPIQGIFIEHTNDVLITGNAIAGPMINGISLSTTNTALVEDNYLQAFPDLGTRIIVRGQSADVSVIHNDAPAVVSYADGGIANPNFVSSNNTIIGSTAAGDLSGMNTWISQHADKSYVGTAAGDVLTAGSGDDTLNGMVGADTMSGGYGNDTYVVDNAQDVVSEQPGAGVDTVQTTLATYTLPDNVENLTLVGSSAQSGVGNALNNVLTSNGVSSTLNGGAGDDTLVVNGGSAVLTGGAGHDVFTFAKAPTGTVQITDFTQGSDTLDLHNLLATYHGADPVADHWVTFQADATGTTVLVDMDGPSGPGGFVAVAKLAGVTSLTSADWVFN